MYAQIENQPEVADDARVIFPHAVQQLAEERRLAEEQEERRVAEEQKRASEQRIVVLRQQLQEHEEKFRQGQRGPDIAAEQEAVRRRMYEAADAQRKLLQREQARFGQLGQ